MPEFNLQRRPVLAGMAKEGRIGRTSGAAGVVAREVRSFAGASILAHKGGAAATASRLSELLQMAVLDAPKRTALGSVSVTGVAPAQWLLIDRDPSRPTIETLRDSLSGAAVVVDQSDSRLILELSGECVRSTLAKGVPVDLDASVFKPGDAAQTVAAHIGLQVAMMTERPAFEVIAAASTAGSFWSWFAASAAEFSLDVI